MVKGIFLTGKTGQRSSILWKSIDSSILTIMNGEERYVKVGNARVIQSCETVRLTR